MLLLGQIQYCGNLPLWLYRASCANPLTILSVSKGLRIGEGRGASWQQKISDLQYMVSRLPIYRANRWQLVSQIWLTLAHIIRKKVFPSPHTSPKTVFCIASFFSQVLMTFCLRIPHIWLLLPAGGELRSVLYHFWVSLNNMLLSLLNSLSIQLFSFIHSPYSFVTQRKNTPHIHSPEDFSSEKVNKQLSFPNNILWKI